MEFKNENGATGKDASAKELTAIAQNGAVKQIANIAKAPANGKHEAEKIKPEPAKQETPKPDAVQKDAIAPKQDLQQAEAIPAKPELTLDAKLKVVNDLHRKSIQRINLMSRMKQLEDFEIALAQESDELSDNPYQGCKLILKDDKQHEFVTTTPGLIRLVAQFIFESCNAKLAEIESTINFPNI